MFDVDALAGGAPAKASANSGPVGRMSWATRMRVAPLVSAAKRANAAPTRSTMAASSWSGTVPRMS